MYLWVIICASIYGFHWLGAGVKYIGSGPFFGSLKHHEVLNKNRIMKKKEGASKANVRFFHIKLIEFFDSSFQEN